jgi:hypothetical protein
MSATDAPARIQEPVYKNGSAVFCDGDGRRADSDVAAVAALALPLNSKYSPRRLNTYKLYRLTASITLNQPTSTRLSIRR